jgi:hypothetical protein
MQIRSTNCQKASRNANKNFAAWKGLRYQFEALQISNKK